MAKSIFIEEAEGGWVLSGTGMMERLMVVMTDQVELLATVASKLGLDVVVLKGPAISAPAVATPEVIKPTVGRIVWYRPEEGDPLFDVGDIGPFPAVICKVWNDNTVNLSVCDRYGKWEDRGLVMLRQPGDDMPSGSYCEWMPYQVGQAAKAEELQAKIRTMVPEGQQPLTTAHIKSDDLPL